MTDNDKQDILTDNADIMIDTVCKMVALAKEKQTNVRTVIYVDNEGNDAVAYVYDFNLYSWKSGDTFDNLARDKLGDADLGTLIAYYNGIANEAEVAAGTEIKIPVLTETQNNQANRIYAEPDRQNNYGADIGIDGNGEFCVKNGDFGTVANTENLSQAIALRLTTASRKRIRLNAYGIRSSIGDTMAVQSYLISSIEQTVKADPRIKEVEEISVKADGDKLRIDIVYTDINGSSGTYKGEI